MTVMSEGLLLNSKYINMGREEGVFQAFLSFPWTLAPQIICHKILLSHTRRSVCPEMIRVSFSLFLSLSMFCCFTLLFIFIKINFLLFS